MKLPLLASLISIQFTVLAQPKKILEHIWEKDSLKIINNGILDFIVSKSEASAHLIVIYTNHCGGTHFILKEVKEYDSRYGDKLNIILANTEPYREIPELKKVLSKYAITLPTTCIIDSETYKEKKSDSRVKGYKIRNDICKECKVDIIGVPYCLFYGKGRERI